MQVAYFHAIGGASGDMMLSSLLDVGLSLEDLKSELAKLPLPGYALEVKNEQRAGLHGTYLEVKLDNPKPGSLPASEQLLNLERSSLEPIVKERAISVIKRLITAEKRAHAGDTTWHELGTPDTLIDVVGVIAGLNLMGIEKVYASPIPTGSGTVKSAHGLLPVPTPATLELLAMSNAPTLPPPTEPTGELTTPTGAALLTTLASFDVPNLQIQRVGYGLGRRDIPKIPNALGIWVARTTEENQDLVILETNIDDMNPEVLAYAQEQLFSLGAYDVWITQIGMKKSRNAALLSVLGPSYLEEQFISLILKETSTLGIRIRPVRRHEAQRQIKEIDTPLGKATVKLKLWNNKIISISPEYEVCRQLAMEHNLPLQMVYQLVQTKAAEKFMPEQI